MLQNFRTIRQQKKAFTLVEVLIAASIFTVVSMICVTVFVNVIRIQKRIELENGIYEDARLMMERIGREIRQNTVDYEEYYNKAENSNPQNAYGTRYGCYAKRFYNPGTPAKFGTQCIDGTTNLNAPTCVIDHDSEDKNTFQNPFVGSNAAADSANAFCDSPFYQQSNCATNTDAYYQQNALYMINAAGTEKTFLALKQLGTKDQNGNPENSVALLKLDGEDNDHDGITETWNHCLAADNKFCCAPGFDCSATKSPNLDSLESTLTPRPHQLDPYVGFIPISPPRTNVESLKFFVAPLEDPRKASAERADEIQQQPHVTVVITVKPSLSSLNGYTGEIPSITLQNTITSRVYNEVNSFFVNDGQNGANAGLCAGMQ